MTTILATGGTGTPGRLVTERLRADGHEVRVLSRHTPPYAVDLREGGAGRDTGFGAWLVRSAAARVPPGGR